MELITTGPKAPFGANTPSIHWNCAAPALNSFRRVARMIAAGPSNILPVLKSMPRSGVPVPRPSPPPTISARFSRFVESACRPRLWQLQHELIRLGSQAVSNGPSRSVNGRGLPLVHNERRPPARSARIQSDPDTAFQNMGLGAPVGARDYPPQTLLPRSVIRAVRGAHAKSPLPARTPPRQACPSSGSLHQRSSIRSGPALQAADSFPGPVLSRPYPRADRISRRVPVRPAADEPRAIAPSYAPASLPITGPRALGPNKTRDIRIKTPNTRIAAAE